MIEIADLAQHHPGLVTQLKRYDYASVAPLVGGFLTLPNYHENTIRLDALAHLACYACAGTRKADREMLVKCAGGHLVGSELAKLEDPVEDAFIGNVATSFGNFRVFRGIEESGDYWVEQILRPLERADVPEALKPSLNHIRSFLKLVDAVASRRQLQRYTFSSGQFCERIAIPPWHDLSACSRAVTFSPADLQQLGINYRDIAPFLFTEEDRKRLLEQSTGHSDLERYPIVQFANNLVLAAPHAVTVSVRRFLVEQLTETGFLSRFAMLLQTSQFAMWMRTLEHGLGFEPMDIALPSPPNELPAIYQATLSFDQGKYAHVVLLDGNISGELTDAHDTDELTAEHQNSFEKHLLDCAAVLKAQPQFNGGMTLITRGGVGRGVALSMKKIPDWGMIFASPPDWRTLARCDDMSALRLWRMWRHQEWAEKRGVHIVNLNGLLNLYAYWRSNNWRFVPRQMELSQPHKMLTVGTGFIADIRKEVLHAYDDHSILAHDLTHWVRVERRGAKAYYARDKEAPVYIALEGSKQKMLMGVIETTNRNWWIVSKANTTIPDEQSVLFQLWDCLLNWMNRAGVVVEKEFRNLQAGSILIELDVQELSKWADQNIPNSQVSSQPTSSVNRRDRTIVVTLPAEFSEKFHTPRNQAERMLIDCTIPAIAELAGSTISADDRVRLLASIFPNDEARFFHFVKTENWAQILAATYRPSPDFIPEEECSHSLIELADELGPPSASGKSLGREQCMDYLHRVVDNLWQRIEKELAQFNRREVVIACFSALAELEKDEQRWSLAARALLALHDPQEILKFAEGRRSDRDAATLANRLLVETAMYACPAEGGHAMPKAARLEMLAQFENLLSAANHRDAISEGFMEPEIHSFQNGELDFDKEFYATVMSPYVRAVFEKGFHCSAQNYDRWFSSYQPKESARSLETIRRMEQPFHDEFGVTIDQFVAIPNRFGHVALKTQKLILELDDASFRSLLMNECNLEAKTIEFFIGRFSLPPRRGWNRDLHGYQEKDVQPWRFRRQLSLLMRPFVMLRGAPSKIWLVYPPLVKTSAAYIIGNIAESAFPTEHFRTRTMRAFCGDQANRQGNQFTRDVADRAEKLGFVARREVFMSALGCPASAGDFGDVDVLAWKGGSPDIYVIECKRLRTAISVRDVVERLDDYRGEREDSLGKHLRRLNWLKANPSAVCALTGIPATAIRFKGLLVTDDLVPMQFFSGSATSPKEVVAFTQLAEAMQ
jgi:hypothetical protein